MVNEAAKLAKSPVSVSGPDSAQIPTTHAEASVLPQVKTALQRIITRWGELHKRKRDREKQDKAAYTLDFETFAPFAGIAGAIDALGEEAWESWQKTLAESTGTNLRSIFGQRELTEEQNRRFADLMSGLVDAGQAEQQDLSKLLRGGERARRHQALVEALLEQRILTRVEVEVDEGQERILTRVEVEKDQDRLYVLLSHRSVLDHWQRAAEWLKQTAPRLKVKAKLIQHYQLEDTSDRWREDDLDDFAGLALNWIGSGEEDDGRALDYLKSGLRDRFDPAEVDIQAKTELAGLPFTALFAGDTGFFGKLWDKCMASPAWADIAPGLVIAISNEGKVAFLEAALDGADTAALCNTVDEETGLFPLLLAADQGHAEAVGLLLDKDAEPNQVHEKNGTFPLLQAAKNGHAEVVRLLLDKDAEPNQVNEKNGLFPLLLAAQEGHAEVVGLLLDKDAEPNQVDEKDSLFPLLQAAQQGHAEVVRLLLDKDAEPNQVNEKNGTFPLLQAAQQGHAEVVGLLLDKDAEPNQVDEKNSNFPLLQAAQNGHAEVVRLLLDKDAEPNQVNEKDGLFPLLQAAQNGHAEVVRLLLDKDAEPNQVDEKDGLFPLLQAAQNGHAEVVGLLLDKDADITQQHEPSGIAPLAAAIMAKQGSTAILLLNSGALIGDLPKPLVTLMVHILSGGDWPRNGESEDAGQQTRTDHDASADLAAAIPAFPIPGHWAPVDVDKRLEKGLSEILKILLHGSPDIVVKGHVLSRRLSLSGNDSVCLWQSALAVAQTEHTLIVDLLWLDGGDRFEPLLLFPGVSLDDILVGLREKSVLPDFRLPETKMIWGGSGFAAGRRCLSYTVDAR